MSVLENFQQTAIFHKSVDFIANLIGNRRRQRDKRQTAKEIPNRAEARLAVYFIGICGVCLDDFQPGKLEPQVAIKSRIEFDSQIRIFIRQDRFDKARNSAGANADFENDVFPVWLEVGDHLPGKIR